ncbi:MAG TPA: hypothetical protein VGR62_11335 [Candidatus Binatia bacterium]|nr:hypothetical protein [Candidatus Binatia bacterium]
MTKRSIRPLWLTIPALAVTTMVFAADVVPPAHVERMVAVESASRVGDTVTGRLVNRTNDVVTDVQVMIRDTFSWTNERSPGSDDPGQATNAVVKGPIPPGGSVTFELTEPAPPHRTDGSYETAVSVISFTKLEPPARTGSAN